MDTSFVNETQKPLFFFIAFFFYHWKNGDKIQIYLYIVHISKLAEGLHGS